MDPASGLIPLVKLRDALDGHMQAGRYWFEDVYDLWWHPRLRHLED
jgi:hypothetical protein